MFVSFLIALLGGYRLYPIETYQSRDSSYPRVWNLCALLQETPPCDHVLLLAAQAQSVVRSIRISRGFPDGTTAMARSPLVHMAPFETEDAVVCGQDAPGIYYKYDKINRIYWKEWGTAYVNDHHELLTLADIGYELFIDVSVGEVYMVFRYKLIALASRGGSLYPGPVTLPISAVETWLVHDITGFPEEIPVTKRIENKEWSLYMYDKHGEQWMCLAASADWDLQVVVEKWQRVSDVEDMTNV